MSSFFYSPEFHLIRLCARTHWTPFMEQRVLTLISLNPSTHAPSSGTIGGWSKGIRWPAVVRLSRQLGVAPLVYRNLNRLPRSVVPEEAEKGLSFIYYQNLSRNVLFASELTCLVKAFNQAKVPVIVLKGIPLSGGVYGHIGSRTMGDIDMLVPRDAMASAAHILVNHGFQPMRLRGGSSQSLDSHYAMQFRKKTQSLSVEIDLHWKLRDRYFRIPEEYIWSRGMEIKINNQPVRVPPWETQVVYLALHLHEHDYAFKVLVDMAELLRKYGDQLDWQRVISLVDHCHMRNNFSLALACAGTILESPLPSDLSMSRRWETWSCRTLRRILTKGDLFFAFRKRVMGNEYGAALIRYLLLDDWLHALVWNLVQRHVPWLVSRFKLGDGTLSVRVISDGGVESMELRGGTGAHVESPGLSK